MSIPSGVLVEEIKKLGFSAFPQENSFGEICIGYGHRIMNTPDLLSPFDSDLAHAIKLYDGNGFYDLKSGELIDYQKSLNEKVLSCGFSIDTARAEELLFDDIITVFEELSRESSGFRHLANLCGNGHLLPNTQMFSYLIKLKRHNKASHIRDSSEQTEHFKYPQGYDKETRNPRFAVLPHVQNNVSSVGNKGLFGQKMHTPSSSKVLTHFRQNGLDHFQYVESSSEQIKNNQTGLNIQNVMDSDFASDNVRPNSLNNAEQGQCFNKDIDNVNKYQTNKYQTNKYQTNTDRANTNPVNVNPRNASKANASQVSMDRANAYQVSMDSASSKQQNKREEAKGNFLSQDKYCTDTALEDMEELSAKEEKNSGLSQKNKGKKSKKSKKKRWELLALPYSEYDSALIRLDVLMYLGILAGVRKVLNMKAVLASIRMDDFATAAGYMRSHSIGESLGEKAVILSRRMQYGIMISDINEVIPEHLRDDFYDERDKLYNKDMAEDMENSDDNNLDEWDSLYARGTMENMSTLDDNNLGEREYTDTELMNIQAESNDLYEHNSPQPSKFPQSPKPSNSFDSSKFHNSHDPHDTRPQEIKDNDALYFARDITEHV